MANGDRLTNGHWHLDKRVPISLILAIMIQTGSFIWFMSALNSDVEGLERRTARMETRSAQVEANVVANTTSVAVFNENLVHFRKTQDRMEASLERMENMLDAMAIEHERDRP